MICTLSDILKYEHPAVVKRFQKEFPQKANEAEVIFQDLLRFFWLSEKHDQDRRNDVTNPDLKFVFIMDEEMKAIDQMWHIFLLYTKDYMDFCEKYFKQYIHHLPDIVPNMPQDPVAFEQNLERFLNYTFDHLGEGAVRRWFSEN